MTEQPKPAEVTLTRLESGRYQARNSRGATIEFGTGDDQFSPGELFLASIAGCSAVDVDVVTSRRAEPESFEVIASGVKSTEGGNHFEDLTVRFRLRFGAGQQADAARERIPAAVRASRERECTVSRTVVAGTPVEFVIE